MDALEDNRAVGKDLAREAFVGLVRPAEAGALLRIGPEPLSVAWSNASRGVHATGLGVAAESRTPSRAPVEWLGAAPPVPPPGPWFGGWAFDAERAWAGFDAERWVLPEVLAWWDGRRAWIAAFGPAGSDASVLEARLRRVEEVEPFTGALVAAARSRPRDAWDGLMGRALEAIGRGAFDKLVLARVIDVECEQPFVERAVLKALEARHSRCWTFLVRGRDGRAFVGATPETLCEVHGTELMADALAGTAAPGQGAALLDSNKDRREHAAVVEGIREALGPLVAALDIPSAPVVKTLANVDHLHTPIRAALRPAVEALEVARALHPTPAVAGRPRAEAVAWLRAHEGFSRGWYSGAVGAAGPSGLTLSVALRAALLSGRRAEVFVGAGVVAGSTAEAEWLETARKARAVLPALGVHDE